jgi:hypothetical protein
MGADFINTDVSGSRPLTGFDRGLAKILDHATTISAQEVTKAP